MDAEKEGVHRETGGTPVLLFGAAKDCAVLAEAGETVMILLNSRPGRAGQVRCGLWPGA